MYNSGMDPIDALKAQLNLEEPGPADVDDTTCWTWDLRGSIDALTRRIYKRLYQEGMLKQTGKKIYGWQTDWQKAARHVFLSYLGEGLFWKAGYVIESSIEFGKEAGEMVVRWLDGQVIRTRARRVPYEEAEQTSRKRYKALEDWLVKHRKEIWDEAKQIFERETKSEGARRTLEL